MQRQGLLRRMLHGVYVDASVPETPQLRAAAVSCVLPPGAVVCRATAAWLHGVPIDRLGGGDEVADVPVEVCSPIGTPASRRRGVRGYTAHLTDDDVTTVYGVPVTTTVRTAYDLARWCDRWDALALLDALVLHSVPLTDLVDGLPSLDGLPWAEQARELVAAVDPGAQSPMESFMRLRYLDAGFPRPQTQVAVRDDAGVPGFWLDCGLEEKKFGFVYDGGQIHGPEREKVDRLRRAWISERGWRVEVFDRFAVLAHTPEFERAIGDALELTPVVRSYDERRRTRLHTKRRAATTA